MKDKRIEYLLFTYFSGKLTRVEEKELLQWLKSDNENKRTLDQMADWWAIAHVSFLVSELKTDFEKHFGRLPKHRKSSKRKLFVNLSIASKIAASILVLVAISLFSYHIEKEEQMIENSTAYFEAVVPFGSQSKVVLPDNSIVWLNFGSSLRYNVNAETNIREVVLDGEGYFEVATDSLHPFVIKAGKLDIKVLGTSFNVKTYPEDEAASVSLVSGKVNVSLNTTNSKTKEVILAPNQRLIFTKETEAIKLTEVCVSDVYAWKEGWFKFKEQPFTEIARELERKYNIQIRIESESLKKEFFSGSFSYEYTLDKILREIDVEKKYKWSENKTEFVIRNKRL